MITVIFEHDSKELCSMDMATIPLPGDSIIIDDNRYFIVEGNRRWTINTQQDRAYVVIQLDK